MNKIIFLDVDGVLNCEKTWKGPYVDGYDTLDPDMCDLFQDIVQKCNPCIVVLSSTWRLFPGPGLDKLNNWLNQRGITIHSHTPDLSRDVGEWRVLRGTEIDMWLEKNHLSPNRILILDDASDFYEWQRPFHVQTLWDIGLTRELADKAIQILND
jgi:hypothetical protein